MTEPTVDTPLPSFPFYRTPLTSWEQVMKPFAIKLEQKAWNLPPPNQQFYQYYHRLRHSSITRPPIRYFSHSFRVPLLSVFVESRVPLPAEPETFSPVRAYHPHRTRDLSWHPFAKIDPVGFDSAPHSQRTAIRAFFAVWAELRTTPCWPRRACAIVCCRGVYSIGHLLKDCSRKRT